MAVKLQNQLSDFAWGAVAALVPAPPATAAAISTLEARRWIRVVIVFKICPNTRVIQPAANKVRWSSDDGEATRCGGVGRPGGAPGLQNQRGAQQSPRWVRFPSTSAIFTVARL